MTASLNILDVKVAQYNDLSTVWKTEETFCSGRAEDVSVYSKHANLPCGPQYVLLEGYGGLFHRR
jgi:hypothetical protein